MELGEQAARGRHWRFGKRCRSGKVSQRESRIGFGRNQNEFISDGWVFHFEVGGNRLGFFLGLFGGSDGFAHAARMPAVEGVGHRFRHGMRAKI